MNTATDIGSMDAETLAHKIIACGKSGDVMRAILLTYGLEMVASETDPFKQEVRISEHGLLLKSRVPDHDNKFVGRFREWEMAASVGEMLVKADAKYTGFQITNGDDAKRVAQNDLVRCYRSTEHCSECGGPDIYHSLGCSKMEGTP